MVRARDRLFQGLAVLARRPAGREGHEELASGHGRQALARVLGRLSVGPVEEDEKLVAAHTHGRFLDTRRAHEEARDPVQDGIARLVSKLIVVLLEVVDIDHDAAPRAARVGVASRELREIAAVPAARERVAQALVEKAFLEALAIGDVDEDALVEDLARLGVEATICGVDDRSGLTVPPADLELEVVHGAVALEAEELGVAALDPARSVAIVGTRRATEGGRRIAGAIGGAVSTAGAVVVSGLAVGIDGAAHAAAVACGGRTVAVLGSGHQRLYPRAHGHLADQIVAGGGAVISELAPDVGPVPGTFPRRNRVVSGLADATVIVEAGERSGALITASWALEQGRECFVVPGSLDSEQSVGCNRLLRLYPGQARAVPSVAELLEDLGLAGTAARTSPDRRSLRGGRTVGPDPGAILAGLGAAEAAVARAILPRAATLEELMDATGFAPATILAVLTRLEGQGLVVAALGRYAPAGSLAATTPHSRRAGMRGVAALPPAER